MILKDRKRDTAIWRKTTCNKKVPLEKQKVRNKLAHMGSGLLHAAFQWEKKKEEIEDKS